jgi:hypothetical protein
MYYIARTLYNQNKILEAAAWFKERVMLDTGCRFEKYQSMIYITLIAERTHHSDQELLNLYLGIYRMFPEYKETLFYAAISAGQIGMHDRSIRLLEKAYYTETRQEFCVKHIITQKEIPRLLCAYYFKTNLSKCVPFLFKHYIDQGLDFDYRYESYIRLIFRIDPKIVYQTQWLVYSDNLRSFNEIIPIEDSVVFDSTKDEIYQTIVTSYTIRNLLVLNRVDRLPYFPNISSIYLMILKDLPEGGEIEIFPMLKAIIAKDTDHAIRLKDYLSPSASRLVITLEQFLALVGQAGLAKSS